METRQRDCSEAFARQLDRFRPWLRYVLGWTVLAGLTPLGLLLAGHLDIYPYWRPGSTAQSCLRSGPSGRLAPPTLPPLSAQFTGTRSLPPLRLPPALN